MTCYLKNYNTITKLIVASIAFMAYSNYCNAQQSIAKQHINQLASPHMYGRGYVNNGIDIAANYIDSCYASYNLLQFKKLNGYRQKLTYSVNTFPGEMSLTINDSVLLPGIDFIVEPYSKAITRPLQYIYTSKHRISNGKIGGMDLSNQILFVDERASKSLSEQAQEVDNWLKTIHTRKSKIGGIIEATNNKLTWGVSDYEGSIPYILINSSKLNTKRTDTLPKINYISIDQKFIKKYKTNNLCGYIQGTQCPDSMIVFTAHYDHLGMMGKNTVFAGANDNASGTAMLLHIAEYFSKHPSKYTLVFVALTGEEVGLKGSQYFVKNSPFELSSIKFLINIDMAGTGDEGIQIVNSTVFTKETALLDSINATQNLLPQIKKRGEACISDHCPFYLQGVPSIFIYTLGGIKAYHDVYDIPETLPLTKYNEYFKLLTSFIELY